MNEATYLGFVHFFVLDLQPLLESFSLFFLLLLFRGSFSSPFCVRRRLASWVIRELPVRGLELGRT